MSRLAAGYLVQPATTIALLLCAPGAALYSQELTPTAPTVSVTVTGSTNRATVSWTAVRGVLTYQVMRHELDREGKTQTPWAQVAAVPGGPFVDVLPKPSVRYEYRVDAVLRGGALVASAPVTYAAPPYSTATNLSVKGVATGTTAQTTLTWTAATNVVGYHVFRRWTRKDGSVAEHIQRTTAPIAVTSFADVIPQLGEMYDYQVVSIDPTGATYPSDWVIITVAAPLVAPVVTIVGAGDKANLSWGATVAPYYTITRAALDAAGRPTEKPLQVARMTNATSFSDPLPNPGTGYRYQVIPITAEGLMGPPAELDFLAAAYTTPGNVTVAGAGGRVGIAWCVGSGTAGHFVMRRVVNPDGTTTSPVQVSPRLANTSSYVDALPTAGLVYEYQVVGLGMDMRQWASAWVRYVAGKW